MLVRVTETNTGQIQDIHKTMKFLSPFLSPFALFYILVFFASAAFAQAGRLAALEVTCGGAVRFITTPPFGGLATTAKFISAREIFQIVNLDEGELKDGDILTISYEKSIWIEEGESIHRVAADRANPGQTKFTVKLDGAAVKLIAPSGKYVAGGSSDGNTLVTSAEEGDALLITFQWDPRAP